VKSLLNFEEACKELDHSMYGKQKSISVLGWQLLSVKV